MRIIFPVLTAPGLKIKDFLNNLQLMINVDFKEMVVVSPFVDAYIIRNIIKRTLNRDRTITVITRYGKGEERQKKSIDEAISEIQKFSKIDSKLREKVRWFIQEKVHAKFVVVDWKTVLFGSQNLTKYGGLSGNYELGAMLEDEELASKLKPFVDNIINNSKLLYPKGK